MKINTIAYQTLWDVALKHYGRSDAAAVFKISDDNPNLLFDEADYNEGDTLPDLTGSDISRPLKSGQSLYIDEEFEKEDKVINKLGNTAVVSGYALNT